MVWDIFEDMRRLQEDMERAFSNFYTTRKSLPAKSGKSLEKAQRMPVADVYETENSVIAAVELPGIDKENIELNITENSVEIKAEKKQEKEHKAKKFCSYSAASSSFYRKLSLPAEVKPDEAKAEYKNGLLRIELPKTKKAEKKKKVEIK